MSFRFGWLSVFKTVNFLGWIITLEWRNLHFLGFYAVWSNKDFGQDYRFFWNGRLVKRILRD